MDTTDILIAGAIVLVVVGLFLVFARSRRSSGSSRTSAGPRRPGGGTGDRSI